MNRLSSASNSGLMFRIQELVLEAEAFRSIGSNFLNPSTLWALDKFIDDLRYTWDFAPGRHRLLTLNSLQTKVANVRGTRMYARISGVWELTPLGSNSRKEAVRISRNVVFSGIASTRVELYKADDPERMAMWRLELGAADSPGCYFHIQVLGDLRYPPFPKSIKIPRLPSFFVTPMAASDYVLGELFGREWGDCAAGPSRGAPFWRNLQRDRLNRQFKWYQEIVNDTKRSPWIELKEAKPKPDMFL